MDLKNRMQTQPTRTINMDVLGFSADRSRWAQTSKKETTTLYSD